MKNKVWRIALSVLISFALWMYVVSTVSPEQEETFYDIPVSYQNDLLEERGLMIVSDTPTVTVKAKGNRTDLNELNANNITALVDLASIQAPGTQILNYRVIFPGNMAVEALSKDPSVLQLKVENKIKKAVPIQLAFVGSVPEGYVDDKENPVMDTSIIEVVGPESAVTKIDHAMIQVDLSDKTESIVGSFTYDLCDADGEPVDAAMVTTNVEEVNLSVKIQRMKEIPLTVTVVDGGGATRESAKLEWSHSSLWVSGSDSKLQDLNTLELGTINLAELKKDKNTVTFAVNLPEGVTNRSGVNEVSITVSFPELGRKTLTISKDRFVTVGVPVGASVTWITEMVEVELRGPKDVVKNITEADLSVTIDFTEEEMGSVSKAPKITFNGLNTNVGAISVSAVTATLQMGVANAAVG